MMGKRPLGVFFNPSPHSFSFGSMGPLLPQRCIKQRVKCKALSWDDLGTCKCTFTGQHLHKALCRKEDIDPVHLFTPLVSERTFTKQDFSRQNLSHRVINGLVHLSTGPGWRRTFRSCLVSSKSDTEGRQEGTETNKTGSVEHRIGGRWAERLRALKSKWKLHLYFKDRANWENFTQYQSINILLSGLKKSPYFKLQKNLPSWLKLEETWYRYKNRPFWKLTDSPGFLTCSCKTVGKPRCHRNER